MIRRATSYDEWHACKDNQSLMNEAQREMSIGSPVLVYLLPPRRKPLPQSLRLEIFKRDGPCCAYCGCELTEETFTIDHVDAVANGGGDNPENLTVSCRPCNSAKGARCV